MSRDLVVKQQTNLQQHMSFVKDNDKEEGEGSLKTELTACVVGELARLERCASWLATRAQDNMPLVFLATAATKHLPYQLPSFHPFFSHHAFLQSSRYRTIGREDLPTWN